MRAASFVVLAFALAAGTTSLAQNMVEYSNIAGKTAPATKTLADKINAGTQKLASATAQSGSTASSPSVKTITPGTVTPDQQAAAKPTPAAIFVLSDGKRIESDHYVLTAEGVTLQENGVEHKIPMKSLNVSATTAANEERGLHLLFPTSTSQMTISF